MISARTKSLRATIIACVILNMIACGGERLLTPEPEPPACPQGGGNATSLNVFEATTLRGASLACIRLSADAEYVVVPQMLGADLPYAYQPFLIGSPDGPVTSRFATTPLLRDMSHVAAPSAQQRLHGLLRTRELGMRVSGDVASRARTSRGDTRNPAHVSIADARREFSVLASLNDPPRFSSVTAGLRFTGAHVLLYVDERVANTYSDAELRSLGTLFDDVLYGVDHAAFGQESDIDGNGRIVVLFTPAVNALVSAAECSTMGFATGFFYGFDLANTTAQSNRGEIFYAMVPDQSGVYSCSHTKNDVSAILPATFLHEFQHMISYGHHVVTRGGAPETAWLNEGLSHIAEELGARYYESRYPSPTGRTRPTQLFPDSAETFITGDLFNSYRYLRFSEQYSVTACAPGSFCTSSERGGAWLFLRWLADSRTDPLLLDKLVHSELEGTRNVEAVAGRPFADLFGDFAVAVWGDSVVGSPRASTSAPHRFASRSLRVLYSALYDAYGPLGGIPQRYPVSPVELTPGARLESAMRPGSFQVFHLKTPDTRREYPLAFTSGSGAPFGQPLTAQLSILRLPLK